jgi:uncharacterized protein (TIGR00369 family)
MTPPREDRLRVLVEGIPYLRFLGLRFEAAGEELTTVLPFRPMLIGNPMIPALHGGVTAAFLEATAVLGLVWTGLGNGEAPGALPKTIDLTVDYLRAGRPADAFARARISRSGRRYASVRVEAWQDAPDRLFAEASGHFLMPDR